MKVLLVTGSSRGIGAEICRQAAADGWKVCINYSSSEDEADRLGAVALHGGLDGLDTQRGHGRVQVVETGGEEVGVDRGDLESGVAQVYGAVERRRRPTPLGTQPSLNGGLTVQEMGFQGQQGTA